MSHISKRSLKASEQGIQLADRAILKFPTKIDFAAELEISRSTVQNFFAGKPVGRENFHKICQELDLSWQDVAQLPTVVDSQTEPAEAITQESVAEEIELDTEAMVTKLRMQVQPRIWSMCGTMRILDMSCPMQIEDIYVNTRVYEKITGRRRLEVNSVCLSHLEDRIPVEERDAESGLSAVTRYEKLFVLGKPGSGKTIFLKYLAWQCSKGTIEPERIPIFVPLRDFTAYDSSLNLLNYIVKQLNKDCQPTKTDLVRRLLDRGKFFIIIDGLDEVKTLVRQNIYNHLRRFTEWFPRNRYIISCRHGIQYCNFEQFTEVEIADFQTEQIADFADKWFKLRDNGHSDIFLQKLEQNQPIRELSTNPLLLTLLCILFNESVGFPSTRSEIYEECLDIMLKQWDVERSIERETGDGLSLEHEKELLCAMALRTFEHKQYYFKEAELKFYIADYIISSNDLSKVNAKKVIKSLEAKHGLIVEQAKKIYSFSHLTFQEYLTARKFVGEHNLTVSTAMLQHLVKHIAEERWREIFLLVAEMSPQANDLFSIMSQQMSSQLVDSPKIKIFLDWVNRKADSIVEITQIEPIIARAFYFSLGISQISGGFGNNFDLALKLNPKFGITIGSNSNLALDLSLFHVCNLKSNLKSIQHPGLTFERILNRAIAHAAEVKPKLASELQAVARQLPTEDNTAQFRQWWKKQNKVWLNNINSLAAQYCNMGYRWQLDDREKQSLEQYYRSSLLLLDCFNVNCNADSQVKQTITDKLFTQSHIESAEFSEVKLVSPQNIA